MLDVIGHIRPRAHGILPLPGAEELERASNDSKKT